MATAAELLVKVGWDNSGVEQGARDAEKTVDGLGDRLGGLGKKVGLVAGAALGAALASGLSTSLDTGASLDRLSAQLGATGPEAERLGAVAGSLYADAYGSSLDEVGTAIASVTRNIGEGNEEWLRDSAVNSLNIASTFEQDMDRVTGAVATMLNTGVAQSSEEAFDVLTKGFQGPANKADDLLDTFIEYSTIFRGLGLDSEEALGLMNQGLQAGARNSDVVADALKEFQIRAQDGSKATAEGFTALGLDAAKFGGMVASGGEEAQTALQTVLGELNNIEDPVQRNAAAVALFGTKAEDLAGALGALDPGTAVQSLGEVTGAAAELDKTLNDNAKTTIETFKRQAMGSLVSFIEGRAIPAFQAFAGFVQENQGPFKVLAGIIGGVLVSALIAYGVQTTVAAVKTTVATAQMVLGWVTSAASATVAAATHVAGWVMVGAQATINAAKVVAGWIAMGVSALAGAAQVAAAWLISIGPIALVIAAVVGLVVLIVKNWDTIKAATAAAWDFVVSIVKKGIDGLVWLFMNFTGPGLIIQHWDTIKRVTSDAWNAVVGFVTGGIDTIVSTISGIGNRIWNVASGMFDGIKNAFRSAINWIIGAWNGLEFSIPGFDPPGPGPKFGGFTLGVPNIPYLAEGGDVRRSGLAFVHQDERVLPAAVAEPLRNGATGAATVTNNVVVNMPPGSDGQDVVNALRRWQRLNGPVPVAVTGRRA